MNKLLYTHINPEKLLLSKWTATQPLQKEKHFLVTEIIRNEQQKIIACLLEAVINQRQYELDWRLLKDLNIWLPGWH
jgi:tryptophan-rich hypothetical protein